MRKVQLKGPDLGPPYDINQMVWMHDIHDENPKEPFSLKKRNRSLARLSKAAACFGLKFEHRVGFEPVIRGKLDSLDLVKELALRVFGDAEVGESGLVIGPVIIFGPARGGTSVTLYKSAVEVNPEELKQLQIKRAGSLLSDSVQRLVN